MFDRAKARPKRRIAQAVAAAAAAVGSVSLTAGTADAGLMIDLRVMTIGGAANSGDPHNIYVGPADVVGVNVYAVVSGTTSTTKRFRRFTAPSTRPPAGCSST